MFNSHVSTIEGGTRKCAGNPDPVGQKSADPEPQPCNLNMLLLSHNLKNLLDRGSVRGNLAGMRHDKPQVFVEGEVSAHLQRVVLEAGERGGKLSPARLLPSVELDCAHAPNLNHTQQIIICFLSINLRVKSNDLLSENNACSKNVPR